MTLQSCSVTAYQTRQRHASDGADQFDCWAVMNVTISDWELFRLALVIVNFNTQR